MEARDLIVTPIYMVLLTMVAYFIRPYVTNRATRKYFLPALWVRFAGAIALGLIYQFYYNGGDTFNYFTHGSAHIWEAFLDSPQKGILLLLDSGGHTRPMETYQYSQRIWYYMDEKSFIIVRLVAFFDLFTLHTYSASALLFAAFSFSGLWAMFSAISVHYRNQTKQLALLILFFPSVVFWGSGILKDTITLGAIGWLTWGLFNLIELNKNRTIALILVVLSSVIIYKIKSYVLICFLPLVSIWLLFRYISNIKNLILRVLLVPFLLLLFGGAGFMALLKISSESEKYQLDTIAERARITAYDIRYGWGARTGGDGGYDIGMPDGTIQSMISLMPAAINVSLFRPYLWEVKNPLMLLSALEALLITIILIRGILKSGTRFLFKSPFLTFCLSFSLLFAFAVGISTFNFGTLMRYKIPMLPFFLMAVFIQNDKSKR